MACLLGSGFFRTGILSLGGGTGLSPVEENVGGFTHLVSCALIFCTLYGPRLFPASRFPLLPALDALVVRPTGWRVASLSLPGFFLLAFHAASILGLGWWSGWGVASPTLWACANPSALLWAPLYEELLFRAALFSLALHKGGGDVPLALALSTGAFAAMHAPNALTNPGGDWVYVGLQVVGAGVCGGAWGAMYARTGSLLEVTLLHAANNAAAVAWLGAAGGGSCALASPPPSSRTPALLSLGLQTLLYTAAGVMAWRGLERDLGEGGGEGGEGGKGEGRGWQAFKDKHWLVYGGGASGASGGGKVEGKKD